jgi:hypothetical protein
MHVSASQAMSVILAQKSIVASSVVTAAAVRDILASILPVLSSNKCGTLPPAVQIGGDPVRTLTRSHGQQYRHLHTGAMSDSLLQGRRPRMPVPLFCSVFAAARVDDRFIAGAGRLGQLLQQRNISTTVVILAKTHYESLGVSSTASQADIKTVSALLPCRFEAYWRRCREGWK